MKRTFYGVRVKPHVPELGGLWLTEPRGPDRAPVSFRSLTAAQITARALGDAWEAAELPVIDPPPPTPDELERGIRGAIANDAG